MLLCSQEALCGTDICPRERPYLAEPWDRFRPPQFPLMIVHLLAARQRPSGPTLIVISRKKYLGQQLA